MHVSFQLCVALRNGPACGPNRGPSFKRTENDNEEHIEGCKEKDVIILVSYDMTWY